MGINRAREVVIKRGDIWWATLPPPRGSEPGYRRPVLIVQSNTFNQTPIRTIIVAILTTNLRLGAVPGNLILRRRESRLESDSVINVSQILALSRGFLIERVGQIPQNRMEEVDAGLRTILSL